jgi:ubiquinone/menaquinone biosynthesis C-methylase UbiE
MAEKPIEFGSPEYGRFINDTYDEGLLRCMDVIGRDDFYGIVAWKGIEFFGEKLELDAESHLLDLGCGVGGPARFLAKTYGCRVTGIDLSEFNVRAAQERATQTGLGDRVSFIHGNALEIPFAPESFTHALGCEAFCYFPDKVQLYAAAHRVLKPQGAIGFLEAACEAPVRLRTEEHLASVKYESVGQYAAMLRAAGFDAVESYDTTELASRDITHSMYRLVSQRERVLAAAGAEAYYALLEIWAEFLGCFSEGKLTHCGMIARKP